MEQVGNQAEDQGQPAADDLELGYHVDLDAFAGPLDLLLYLVRKAEVDIADIPVARIADQFVATIAAWEDLDLDIAGEFILMAATLLEIKARLIMPAASDAEGDSDEAGDLVDPRADLIGQLLAYRDTKERSDVLSALEGERLRWHGRRFSEQVPDDPEEAEALVLDNADPYALFRVWEKIQRAIAGHGPRTVIYDDVPIEERVREMEAAMAAAREARLDWFLDRVDKPVQRVGVVVAALEVVRKGVVEATQHEQYGAVHLRWRDAEERDREPALPPPPAEEPQRRRRRLPLITWRPAPGQDAEADDGSGPEPEEEVAVESDEQRFLRELEEQTGVDTVLARIADLDAGIQAHLLEAGVIEPPSTGVEPGEAGLVVSAAGAATPSDSAG